MTVLLICAVAFLAFANGANDNFKGVATLWGAGLSSYRQAITWATGFTFLGSMTAI
jgi:inorganic phosphate transporter, PiT family